MDDRFVRDALAFASLFLFWFATVILLVGSVEIFLTLIS